MVADSRHREKLSKSRKNFHNQEEKFGIHKNISRVKKKIMKSRKKLRNREKKN